MHWLNITLNQAEWSLDKKAYLLLEFGSFSRTLFYFENLRAQIAYHSERSEESEAEGRSFFF